MIVIVKQNGKEAVTLDDVIKLTDKGGAYEISCNDGKERAVYKSKDIVLELY